MPAGSRLGAHDPLVNPLLDRRVADAEPACGLSGVTSSTALKNRIDTLEKQAKFAVNCIDDVASDRVDARLRAPRAGSAPSGPITVAAAVSLTEVLDEIARAYAAAGGGLVRFNLAGSNVLARQIVNSAPADVFISADETQMDVVEKAGAVLAGSRVDLVANQLAVVATPDRVELVRREFARAPAEIRRLAIGDPAAVPAGVYARRYLEQRGLWAAYEPRVVPTTNVRSALTAVETGSVDAAIVYLTDLAAARTAVLAFTVPTADGPRHRLSGGDSCVHAKPGRGEEIPVVSAAA